jgi:hypothetical protein
LTCDFAGVLGYGKSESQRSQSKGENTEEERGAKEGGHLNFVGNGRIFTERASLFRCLVRSRVHTGKMAEEMSGRKPTFCCSEDVWRVERLACSIGPFRTGNSKGNDRSRFPSGMTSQKATATAEAKGNGKGYEGSSLRE